MFVGGVPPLEAELGAAEPSTQQTTESPAARVLKHLGQSFGLPHLSCHAIPMVPDDLPPKVLWAREPAEWRQAYEADRLDLSDPTLRMARQRVSAFTWSDLLARGRLSRGEVRLMAEARTHGIAEAFVVPIWSIGGWIGLVTLAGTGRPLSQTDRDRLTAAAVPFYSGLSARRRAGQPHRDSLTDREYEVVRWLAAGKSDWEIGQILDISAKTVNFHVENAKRKLGVSTRIQAVLRALDTGHLDD